MTNKELMALPLDERRKIMEEQSADLVDYYKTTNLWENLEGEEDFYDFLLVPLQENGYEKKIRNR